MITGKSLDTITVKKKGKKRMDPFKVLKTFNAMRLVIERANKKRKAKKEKEKK